MFSQYENIENELRAVKRRKCVFLSVKVVGSAEMKVSEDAAHIGMSFQAFEEMVRKIFRKYGAWKQSGAPGSLMVCFLDPSLAVGAAQRILQRLYKFNLKDNKLRTPFRVRCGLGEGVLGEGSEVEKVVSFAIDVAGDMQKHARPNALWVPAEVFDALPDQSGFRPANTVVSGHPAFEWSLGG